MTSDLDRATLEAALAGRGAYELFACDPALADKAAFCTAYGFEIADAANTIVVVGKSDPPAIAPASSWPPTGSTSTTWSGRGWGRAGHRSPRRTRRAR